MSGTAAAAPLVVSPDPLALAQFEAGLDGLAENDLVDEAEVDSIVRETVLHTIGDLPWTDAKVGYWAVCHASAPWVLHLRAAALEPALRVNAGLLCQTACFFASCQHLETLLLTKFRVPGG